MDVVNVVVNGDSDLPAILLGIVVGYLTILISVAIAIFSDKKDFEALDRNVILDHILKAKLILLYLGLTFIPLLFWNGSLSWTRLLEIFFWIIGVFFITKILINSYHWMKGNKYRFRFNYLKDLRNKQDMEEAWRSVWQTENINFQNEQEFFKIFFFTINQSLENDEKIDNLVIASKLLGDFNNFINKRTDLFLKYSDMMLSRILEWHFEIWKKEYEYLGQDKKLDEWGMYSQLSRILDSIFRQIEIYALKEKASFNFFDKLKKHTEKYKKESVSSRSYVESLFDTFYQVFFENIYDSPERFNIWEHYYPKEWKITKGNLQDSENIISEISLNNFLNWAPERIWQENKENDFLLDDLAKNLFPEVDPILWAKILIFIFSPYSENRLRSVIERPWNFGFMGRAKAYSSEDEISRMYKDEEINTFDLSYFLFKNEFTKIKLENYIKSLEKLSYPEDSKEDGKKSRLQYLFVKMLAFVKDIEQSEKSK
jgi:hypothetical protein